MHTWVKVPENPDPGIPHMRGGMNARINFRHQERICLWLSCSRLQTVRCHSLATVWLWIFRLLVRNLRGKPFVVLRSNYDDVEFSICSTSERAGSIASKSENIIELVKAARLKVKHIIAMTGEYTELLTDNCDVIISVGSAKTPKIQEVHAIAGHMICESVEHVLFGNSN